MSLFLEKSKTNPVTWSGKIWESGAQEITSSLSWKVEATSNEVSGSTGFLSWCLSLDLLLMSFWGFFCELSSWCPLSWSEMLSRLNCVKYNLLRDFQTFLFPKKYDVLNQSQMNRTQKLVYRWNNNTVERISHKVLIV